MSSMPPPPPEMPPPPPPGMPPGGPYGAPYGYAAPATGTANLAEWWQRGLAVTMDFVLIAVISGVLSGPSVERTTSGGGTSVHVRFGGIALTFVAWTLYAGLMNGLKGQTLGKMALGIRVVRRDTGALLGAPLGLARAALHDVMWQLCCFPGLLDSLWPLWDKERQSLHDKAVGSVVVRSR